MLALSDGKTESQFSLKTVHENDGHHSLPLYGKEQLGYSSINNLFKVIVHSKIKILSSVTLHHDVPNLYGFLSSVEHQRMYFEKL